MTFLFKNIVVFISIFLSVVFAKDIIEKATGHSYKPYNEDNKQLSLAGVGVRSKQIGPVNLKLYSAGFYMDKSIASTILKKFKVHDLSKLQKGDEFGKSIVEGNFLKSIVIKMARDVGSDRLINGVAESVKKRLGKDLSPLTRFQSILNLGVENGVIKRDTVLSFESNQQNNKLIIRINGKKQGTVDSKDLCKAFQNVYLDKNCVSDALKCDIIKNIHKEWI